MEHGDNFWVCKGLQYQFGVIAFAKGAGWTVGDALPTERAVCFADVAVVANVNSDARAGTGNIPDIETLDFITNLDTTHAFDTLAVITDKRGGHVPDVVLNVLWEWIVQHVEFASEFL